MTFEQLCTAWDDFKDLIQYIKLDHLINDEDGSSGIKVYFNEKQQETGGRIVPYVINPSIYNEPPLKVNTASNLNVILNFGNVVLEGRLKSKEVYRLIVFMQRRFRRGNFTFPQMARFKFVDREQ